MSGHQTVFDYFKIMLHSKVTFWTTVIITKDVYVDMPCNYNYSHFCFHSVYQHHR